MDLTRDLNRRRATLAAVIIVIIGGALGVVAAAWRQSRPPAPVQPTAALSIPESYYIDSMDSPEMQRLQEIVGHPMPPLSVANWVNGEVKPQDLKGKVVLIDLWATWCGPCLRSIPHNNELFDTYREKGVVVIGVCTSGAGQERLSDVISQFGVKYPSCNDPALTARDAYHVGFFPTYVLIDRSGIVRAAGLSSDHVENVVKRLVGE